MTSGNKTSIDERISVNEVKHNRTINNINMFAVNSKTSNGKDVKTYISKYTGLRDPLSGEFIKAMPAVYDSPGYWKIDEKFQRKTDAVNSGYITIEDADTEGVVIIQLFPAVLRTNIRGHPRFKPLYEQYIKLLVPAETPSITVADYNTAIEIINKILNEDTGQKTISVPEIKEPEIKEYQITMTLSITKNRLAGFVPEADLMDFIKKEKPELLAFQKPHNPKFKAKAFIQDGHARLIVELW